MVQKLKKSKFGFTLMEILIAIAVLAILGGIAAAVVPDRVKEYKQTELDSKAEVIYSAAQNRLSELRSSGNESVYRTGEGKDVAPAAGLRSFSGYTASDFSPLPTDPDGLPNGFSDIMCYTTSDSDVLNISERLNSNISGKWIIEFNFKSGTVYSVFYSEDGGLGSYTPDQLDALGVRDKAARKKFSDNKTHIGYYGGSDTAMIRDSIKIVPVAEIVNDEELYIKLSLPLYIDDNEAAETEIKEGSTVNYKFTLAEYGPNGKPTGKEYDADINVKRTQLTDDTDGKDGDASYCNTHLILDSLSKDMPQDNEGGVRQTIKTAGKSQRYVDMLGLDGFTPGYNLIVTDLTAVCTSPRAYGTGDDSDIFNSLFANPDLFVDFSEIDKVDGEIRYNYAVSCTRPIEQEQTILQKLTNLLTADTSETLSMYGGGTAFTESEGNYTGTAALIRGRHMQNLDSDSGVASVFKNAFIVGDINFGTKSNWQNTYGGDKIFTPITNTNLTGTFDGNGTLEENNSDFVSKLQKKVGSTGGKLMFTIRDLVIDSSEEYVGLFGQSGVKNITDLNMAEPQVKATKSAESNISVLIGANAKAVTIKNTVISDAYISASASSGSIKLNVGTMVGMQGTRVEISNCILNNPQIDINTCTTRVSCGVGMTNGNQLTVTGLNINEPLIDCTQSTESTSVGSVVGYCSNGENKVAEVSLSKVYVRNPAIYASTSSGHAGAFVGRLDSSSKLTISDSKAYLDEKIGAGAVRICNVSGFCVGGFVGFNGEGSSLLVVNSQSALNLGSNKSIPEYVGGFVGFNDNGNIQTISSSTHGNYIAKTAVGGFIGCTQGANANIWFQESYTNAIFESTTGIESGFYYDKSGANAAFFDCYTTAYPVDKDNRANFIPTTNTTPNMTRTYYAFDGIGDNSIANQKKTVKTEEETENEAQTTESVTVAPEVGLKAASEETEGLIVGSVPVRPLTGAKHYTVSYDANGGTGAPASQTTTTNTIIFWDYESITLSSTKPTRTGYDFKGWATSSTATSADYDPGDTFRVNNDMTLYAVWTVKTYTVTYNANGGNSRSTPASQTKNYGETIRLTTSEPTRTSGGSQNNNVPFLGWSTDSKATEPDPKYAPGSLYSENMSITLYAVWASTSTKGYAVKYYGNGNGDTVTGVPATQIKERNKTLTLSSQQPSREGYDFLGWSTNPDATSPDSNYPPSKTSYTSNSPLSLFAVWKIKTYTITYYGNATDATNVPSSQTKTHGKNLTLSSQEPVRTGYDFQGWSTSKTATAAESKYAPGATYSDNAPLTLYAVWKIKTYTITYKPNGGSGSDKVYSKDHFATHTIISNPFTYTGYKFLGWSKTQGATAPDDTYAPGKAYSTNENLTLYAIWTKNTYTITYDANGGSGAPEAQTGTIGENIVLTNSKPTRTDCTFEGWALSKTADTAQYVSGATYKFDEDTPLYAVWKAVVTYDANGGSNAPGEQRVRPGQSLTLSSKTPTRDDCTFLGWATSATATTATYQPNTPYTFSKNTKLYAVWQITVNYNANEGIGAPSSQNGIAGQSITLSATKPTREGYDFMGWADSATATTVAYEPNTAYTFNKNTTLYAVWQLKTYAVTYNANGGSGAPNGQTKTYGQDLKLSNTAPTREGYTFKGWATSSTATEALYQPGDTYKVNAPLDLFAVWKINSYTITFKNDDGTELQRSDWEYGSTPSYKGTPTKAATAQYTYTFNGWSPKVVSVTKDATYTATYSTTVNKYKVTFKNYDGQTIESKEWEYGKTPKCSVTPTKPSDIDKVYTFDKWTPDIVAVTGTATYTATYKSSTRQYTIKFVNEDGTVLQSSAWDYNSTPEYKGATPTKAATAQYTYTFAGWNKAIAVVTGDATYMAKYTSTLNKYTVTFKNYDGKVMQSSDWDYGATPTYSGETPTKPEETGYTYTFEIWSPAIATVTKNAEYTAQFKATPKKFNVTFKNYNGAVLQSSDWDYGTTPSYTGATPTKPSDLEYNYAFSIWSPAVSEVTGDAVYVAQYSKTAIKYTIKFVNHDGSTLETLTLAKGETPVYTKATPTKTATTQYTYTFSGWAPAITAVTGDAVYTAQFSSNLRTYKIRFENNNGSELATYTLGYGVMPEYKGSEPRRSYLPGLVHFSGWSPALTVVTGDMTYQAQYKELETWHYVITYVEWDGSSTTDRVGWLESSIPYHEPKYRPDTPEYSYEFTGWKDADGNAWTSTPKDVTYYAQYKVTRREYTVTFRNWNDNGTGTPLQTLKLHYGDMPAYTGTTPTRASDAQYDYAFSGWDPQIEAVTGNATYRAKFTPTIRKYKITFEYNVDGGGTAYYGPTMVEYGKPTPTYPNPPAWEDADYLYTFDHWEPTPAATVTAEATYKAVYTSRPLWVTVTYQNYDGTVLQGPTKVKWGEVTPKYEGKTPSRPSDAQYTYTFKGWSPEVAPLATEDVTYVAQFTETIRKYTVKFVNWDDKVLQTYSDIEYGTEIAYTGPTPERPSIPQCHYKFNGTWTPDFPGIVEGDATYKARFDEIPRKYTVKFVNYNGAVLQSTDWVYGETPEYSGKTPEKPSTDQYQYTFIGWEPEISTVTGEATYTAQYSSTVRKYYITFKNEDGTELQKTEVEYGTMPVYTGAEPTKTPTAEHSYTFHEWNPALEVVTGEATYTAQFDEHRRQYTVTFVNYDETTVLQTGSLYYGDTPVYSGDTPEKPSTVEHTYTFTGWKPEISAVTGDQTYVAQFEENARKYTIKFVNWDNSVLQSSEVAYDETPKYTGATPTKPASAEHTYTFTGWQPEISAVTGEQTYVAQFVDDSRLYTVTFLNHDGTVLQSTDWKYGETPVYSGATPTKPSTDQYKYTFAGWDHPVVAVTDTATYTAQFDETLREYAITFVNWDNSVLQSSDVAYGAIPVYRGNTPTRPEDANYTYNFTGWQPEISAVTGIQTYKAQFEAIPKGGPSPSPTPVPSPTPSPLPTPVPGEPTGPQRIPLEWYEGKQSAEKPIYGYNFSDSKGAVPTLAYYDEGCVNRNYPMPEIDDLTAVDDEGRPSDDKIHFGDWKLPAAMRYDYDDLENSEELYYTVIGKVIDTSQVPGVIKKDITGIDYRVMDNVTGNYSSVRTATFDVVNGGKIVSDSKEIYSDSAWAKYNGESAVIITLDSLRADSRRFSYQYNNDTTVGDGEKLTPGNHMSIDVWESWDVISNGDKLPENSFNSLYADDTNVAAKTASIAYGRHLQNLDTGSGVGENITAAQLSGEVKFGEGSAWNTVYGDLTFKPISNGNITSFNGNRDSGWSISDLTVNTKDNAGLFGDVSQGIDFSNTVLIRPNIKSTGGGDKDRKSIGGFVGRVSTTAYSISNCDIIDPLITGAGEYSTTGGFVGSINGGATATITDSAVYVTDREKYTTAKDDKIGIIQSHRHAGGLIGMITTNAKAQIERSFASVRVISKTGAGAGGFIGYGDANVTINNSYTDCDLSGKYAGGFIGRTHNGAHKYTFTSCYSAGTVSISENDGTASAGFLCNTAENVCTFSFTDCYTVLYPTDYTKFASAVYSKDSVTCTATRTYYGFAGKKTDKCTDAKRIPYDWYEGKFEDYISGFEASKLNAYTYTMKTGIKYPMPEVAAIANTTVDSTEYKHFGDWKLPSALSFKYSKVFNSEELYFAAIVDTKDSSEVPGVISDVQLESFKYYLTDKQTSNKSSVRTVELGKVNGNELVNEWGETYSNADWAKYDGKKGAIVTLDSLKSDTVSEKAVQDRRFNYLFNDKNKIGNGKKLTPGNMMTITIEDGGWNAIVDTKDESISHDFNSLFGERGDTALSNSYAVIRCGRHLQNLSNESGFEKGAVYNDTTLNNAGIVNDIDFGTGSEWQSVYGTLNFVPVTTSFTQIVDGGSHTISNLTVNTDAAAAGLFGKKSNNTNIRNLVLLNPSIVTSADSGNAGGLIGEFTSSSTSTAKLSISGCRVIGDKSKISGKGSSGGLVGKTSGSVTASVAQSYAALRELGIAATQYTGGMIGSVESPVTVTASYTDSYLKGGYVGGFFGNVSGSNAVSVSRSYTAGIVESASQQEAGFFYHVNGENAENVNVQNCYTVLYPADTKNYIATTNIAETVPMPNTYYGFYGDGVTRGERIPFDWYTGKFGDYINGFTKSEYDAYTYSDTLTGKYPMPEISSGYTTKVGEVEYKHFGDWKVPAALKYDYLKVFNEEELYFAAIVETVKGNTVPGIIEDGISNIEYVLKDNQTYKESSVRKATFEKISDGKIKNEWGEILSNTEWAEYKDSYGAIGTFDSLKDGNNRRFKTLFGELTPGDDMTLSVYAGGWNAIVDTASFASAGNPQFNSLFANDTKVAKGTAAIGWGRHLQNLDNASGVTQIKNAVMVADVNLGEGSAWETMKGDNGRYFQPIYNEAFTGTFDGKKDDSTNYTVSGLTLNYNNIESGSSNIALFSTYFGSEIRNLTLERPTVKASGFGWRVSALVGKTNATDSGKLTFSNITVNNAAITMSGWGTANNYVGLFAAEPAKGITVNNCTVTEPVITCDESGAYSFVSPLIAVPNGETTINGLVVDKPQITGNTVKCAGVLVGTTANGCQFTVNGCEITKPVISATGDTSSICAGAALGKIQTSEDKVVLNDLIIKDPTVDLSKANGTVSAGGVIGWIENGSAELTGCKVYLAENIGKATTTIPVNISGKNAGGFVGTLTSNGSLKTNASFAAVSVGNSSSENVGGFAGKSDGSFTVENCYADCYLSGGNVGGFIGTSSQGNVKLSKSYSAGKILSASATGTQSGFLHSSGTTTLSADNCYTVIYPADHTNFEATSNINVALSNVYYGFAGKTNYGERMPFDWYEKAEPNAGRKPIEGFTYLDAGKTQAYYDKNVVGTDFPMPEVAAITATSEGKVHYGDWFLPRAYNIVDDKGSEKTGLINREELLYIAIREKAIANSTVPGVIDSDELKSIQFVYTLKDKSTNVETDRIKVPRKMISDGKIVSDYSDAVYPISSWNVDYSKYNEAMGYAITFDSLRDGNNRRFKTLFPTLTPGDIMTITLTCDAGEDYNWSTVFDVKIKDFNSLYGERKADDGLRAHSARIDYGRHLQNLDKDSGITTSAKMLAYNAEKMEYDASSASNYYSADQKSDIDFGKDSEWQATYGNKTFKPIENVIIRYSSSDKSVSEAQNRSTGKLYGRSHLITKLTVNTSGYAGLFSTITNSMELNNVNLVNPSVTSTDSSAGAFAGRVNADDILYIRTSGVFGKETTVTAASNAGGFIGVADSEPEISNSFAATASTKGGSYAGGLIGVLNTQAKIARSYSDSYVEGVKAGGLIGKITGDTKFTYLSSCYSAGFITGTSAGAGLVAEGTSLRIASVTNSSYMDNTTVYTICKPADTCTNYYSSAPNVALGRARVYYLYRSIGNTNYGKRITDVWADDAPAVNAEKRATFASELNSYGTSDFAGAVNIPGGTSFDYSTLPYNLDGGSRTEYPFPTLQWTDKKGIILPVKHAGDWDTSYKFSKDPLGLDEYTAAFCYYEDYGDTNGDGKKEYGVYPIFAYDRNDSAGKTVYYRAQYSGGTYSKINTAETIKYLDTYNSMDESKAIVGDGYGFMVRADDSNYYYWNNSTGTTALGSMKNGTCTGELELMTSSENGYFYRITPEIVDAEYGSTFLSLSEPYSLVNIFRSATSLSSLSGASGYQLASDMHFAKDGFYLSTATTSDNRPSNMVTDPVIRSPRNLYNLSQYYNQYATRSWIARLITFTQEADIDYSTYDWTTYKKDHQPVTWQYPIGDNGGEFAANYEGNSYTIKSLSFKPEQHYNALQVGYMNMSGLFGSLYPKVLGSGQSGQVSGVHLVANGATIEVAASRREILRWSDAYTGCIAGKLEHTSLANYEPSVDNCSATGYTYVVGSDSGVTKYNDNRVYVGGICGFDDVYETTSSKAVFNSRVDRKPQVSLTSAHVRRISGNYPDDDLQETVTLTANMAAPILETDQQKVLYVTALDKNNSNVTDKVNIDVFTNGESVALNTLPDDYVDEDTGMTVGQMTDSEGMYANAKAYLLTGIEPGKTVISVALVDDPEKITEHKEVAVVEEFPAPTTEPAEPTTEYIEPTTEPVEEPVTEPAEEERSWLEFLNIFGSDEPEQAEPVEEPTEPTTEPAEPVEEPTEPTTEPAEPTEEPVEPVEHASEDEPVAEDKPAVEDEPAEEESTVSYVAKPISILATVVDGEEDEEAVIDRHFGLAEVFDDSKSIVSDFDYNTSTQTVGSYELPLPEKFERGNANLVLYSHGEKLDKYEPVRVNVVRHEVTETESDGGIIIETEDSSFTLYDETQGSEWDRSAYFYKQGEPINAKLSGKPVSYVPVTLTGAYTDPVTLTVTLRNGDELITLSYELAGVADSFYVEHMDGDSLVCEEVLPYGSPIVHPESFEKTPGYIYPDEGMWSEIDEEFIFENVTFTTVRTPVTYTVRFDSNGGGGTMESVTVDFEEGITLNNLGLYKEKHMFVGWTTSPDGELMFAEDATVSGLCTENNGEVTLYAVWEKVDDVGNIIVEADPFDELIVVDEPLEVITTERTTTPKSAEAPTAEVSEKAQ